MNKFSKLVSLILTSVIVSTVSFSLIGCDDGFTTVDETKSQLYVSNYDGGFGSEWMDDVISRFEEKYKDVSFEEGKTGVQIVPDYNKTGGIDWLSKASLSLDEVFFTGNMFYYDWVVSDALLDVTDVVTAINADDNNKSIESKMTEDEKNFVKTDGKYFAIPHGFQFFGINYDIDLFENKKLYYAKNGVESENYALDKETAGGFNGTVTYTGTDAKSAGPDGVHGTDDDGLPATYDEFFALCTYMQSKKGITPFIWSGQYAAWYVDYLLGQIMTDYEGYEQAFLNYTFSGKAKNLISVDGSGNVTRLPEKDITPENGYEIYSTAGRYYALKFLQTVIQSNYAHKDSFGSISHIDAQAKFIDSSINNEPIAFLVDGNWWVNEAKSAFNNSAKYNGDEFSAKNRRFGFLPMPKADVSKIGEKSTVLDSDLTFGFIKANIAESKVELAKTFLKFCYTDESLASYTLKSGGIVAMDYSISDDKLSELSPYQQSAFKLAKNSMIVHPFATSKIFTSDQYSFSLFNTFDTSVYNNAGDTLFQKKADAGAYFNGIATKWNSESWNRSFGKFFN